MWMKNTKLSRVHKEELFTVTAPNIEEANKKAKPIIKNSKTFNNFSSRQSFDSPRKPSIKILKPIKAPGGGRDKDGVIQVQEKLLIRDTKFKGGLIRKPKLGLR
jgi:hypothetical protein